MISRVFALLLMALVSGAGGLRPASAEEVTPARCQAVLAAVEQSLGASGTRISARYSGLTDGACEYSDVVIGGGSDFTPSLFVDKVMLAGTVLDYKPDGSAKSADITLTAEAMRMALESGDPRMNYLLQAQSRLGEMSLELRANWDGATKELRVGLFDLMIGESSRIKFAALAKNVDLSTAGSAQMALTGAALTELNLEIKSFGLFEQFLLPYFVMMLPEGAGATDEAGFAELVAERKLELRTAINQLPDASFPAPSRAALAALLSDLPNPRGKLVLAFRSASGFGAARFARYALTGMPKSLKDAAPLFDDTRFDIDWRRGDRS